MNVITNRISYPIIAPPVIYTAPALKRKPMMTRLNQSKINKTNATIIAIIQGFDQPVSRPTIQSLTDMSEAGVRKAINRLVGGGEVRKLYPRHLNCKTKCFFILHDQQFSKDEYYD